MFWAGTTVNVKVLRRQRTWLIEELPICWAGIYSRDKCVEDIDRAEEPPVWKELAFSFKHDTNFGNFKKIIYLYFIYIGVLSACMSV